MRFEYNGDTYRLEFERKRRLVEIVRKHKSRDGKKVEWKETITATHPYTTVRLIKDVPHALPGIEMGTATAGAYKTDKFTRVDGRAAALRALCKGILGEKDVPREKRKFDGLKKIIWETLAAENRSKRMNAALREAKRNGYVEPTK